MNEHSQIVMRNGKKYFFRFTVNERIQHGILALTVIVLVLTGMPLKFSDAFWAPYLYGLFGGIKVAPTVHKIAGVVLLALFSYHVLYLSSRIYGRQIVPLKKTKGLSAMKLIKLLSRQPLVPSRKDAQDIIHLIKYLLFFSDTRPDGAEFTWKEKFDFWAPFWGVVVIGGSGLILWNKELATRILPGEMINFALIAHSDEALLAALFLFIWHWYNVHFSASVFPMGLAFLTGYLSEELMIEDHYDYYVQVMKAEGFEDAICPRHMAEHQGGDEEAAVAYEARQGGMSL